VSNAAILRLVYRLMPSESYWHGRPTHLWGDLFGLCVHYLCRLVDCEQLSFALEIKRLIMFQGSNHQRIDILKVGVFELTHILDLFQLHAFMKSIRGDTLVHFNKFRTRSTVACVDEPWRQILRKPMKQTGEISTPCANWIITFYYRIKIRFSVQESPGS
jgi:hypothetical protein